MSVSSGHSQGPTRITSEDPDRKQEIHRASSLETGDVPAEQIRGTVNLGIVTAGSR